MSEIVVEYEGSDTQRRGGERKRGQGRTWFEYPALEMIGAQDDVVPKCLDLAGVLDVLLDRSGLNVESSKPERPSLLADFGLVRGVGEGSTRHDSHTSPP